MGTKTKYRVEIIYAPKEDEEKKEKIKEMHEKIVEEVIKGQERNQKIVLMGDFNSKVGEKIEGNHMEVSKGGKLLLKMLEKNKMEGDSKQLGRM